MGRTQSFDTATVVGAARDVFWRLGYDATSLGDLERATGLGRSSLYHAFGSKRGLFDAAVENYLDEIVRPRLAGLTGGDASADGDDPAAARAALRSYFAEMSDAVATLGHDDGRAGCLLLISTAGQAGHDAMVRGAVDAYRAELVAAFSAAVRRALPGAATDAVERRARLYTALVVAALTLARVNREEAVATLRLAEDAAGAPVPGP
ncbi:TetR/AcrR family transcriptional regulator [Arthrobacter halodurans]|uniref:TetR/AcrR family transcriptional regulator n=1 Tax=Arthrobacter halodurans TaxID=516699 RepID=A0ABV4UKS9_9MICC